MASVSRRLLLLSASAACVAKVLRPDVLWAQETRTDEGEDRSYKLRWRVSTAHFESVRDTLHFDGEITTEMDQKGIPLVFVFVGVVLIPYLADAVLALRRDMVYGGLVIDARAAEIVIENDPRLDGGTIVVVTAQGTKIYDREEIGNPSDLIAALLKP